MNQVVFRKIALSAACVSIGCFMAVMLLCSVITGSSFSCSAESTQAYREHGIPISCTPLVVETLAYYDGAFYEDGTGTEVMDIAALELRNSSDETIPFASVIVYTENCRYEFEATMLPPDCTVLIPELNKTRLTEKEIARCFGWVTVSYKTMAENLILTENDKIHIRNTSDKAAKNIKVYYKTYLREEQIYVGGRAFVKEIPYIAAGETVSLLPNNYAPGYSRVVWYEIN